MACRSPIPVLVSVVSTGGGGFPGFPGGFPVDLPPPRGVDARVTLPDPAIVETVLQKGVRTVVRSRLVGVG